MLKQKRDSWQRVGAERRAEESLDHMDRHHRHMARASKQLEMEGARQRQRKWKEQLDTETERGGSMVR
jgi:hypothetical protein